MLQRTACMPLLCFRLHAHVKRSEG
jgi:hypothetical protein